jgi:hypothetical protein
LLLTFAAISFSCSKEEKGMEASATGFVKLYNEQGMELYDRTGIQVRTTDGSSSSTTNEMGKYLLTGLKLGKNYNVEISMDGYGTLKIFDYIFLNGPKSNLIYAQNLYKQPSYKSVKSNFYILNCTFLFDSELTRTKYLGTQMFINDSSNVSNTHYDFKSIHLRGSSESGYTSVTNSLSVSSTKYAPGTTVYAVVYFDNNFDPSYYDPELKLYIYPSAVKASEIVSVKIP